MGFVDVPDRNALALIFMGSLYIRGGVDNCGLASNHLNCWLYCLACRLMGFTQTRVAKKQLP